MYCMVVLPPKKVYKFSFQLLKSKRKIYIENEENVDAGL